MPRLTRLSVHRTRPRLEPLESLALLSTLTVTDLGDAGPGTLRAAIVQANSDPAPDTITFAPGLGGTIALQSALPDLATPMTLQGPGAASLTVARDPSPGRPVFRIFTVAERTAVTLSGLTITGGGNIGGPADDSGVYEGGGILNAGTLTISACVVRGNRAWAVSTATQTADEARGGGISNRGTLSVFDSTIADNSAFFQQAPVPPYVSESLRGEGGGIYNWNGGVALIARSTISSNVSVDGGGIANPGFMNLVDVTVSGNQAAGAGGAIYNTSIQPSAGELTVVSTTIAANSAKDLAGGIYNAELLGKFRFDFPAGPITLVDTIVAGNFSTEQQSAPSNAKVIPSDIYGPIQGGSAYNIIGADTGGAYGPNTALQDGVNGNRAGTPGRPLDARLAPLADNGGPTRTHALLPGSPALDAGLALPAFAIDQRGVSRPQGPGTDIGAVEALGLAATPPRVTSARRGPGTIVLSFSQPLDAASAGDTNNYVLVSAGRDGRFGTADDVMLPVRWARYNAATNTVTLRAAATLPPRGRLALGVRGTATGNVTGRDGYLLDGNGDGLPGGDFIASV